MKKESILDKAIKDCRYAGRVGNKIQIVDELAGGSENVDVSKSLVVPSPNMNTEAIKQQKRKVGYTKLKIQGHWIIITVMGESEDGNPKLGIYAEDKAHGHTKIYGETEDPERLHDKLHTFDHNKYIDSVVQDDFDLLNKEYGSNE